MSSEPFRDPRTESLRPTQDEVEAWASREHKRRAAWLAGPTEIEQQDWARRERQRAELSLADSRLGPTSEEIADWARREGNRRQAWLAGPTDAEKRAWAQRHRRRMFLNDPESDVFPSDDEINTWAENEHRRRQAWIEGPTEEEKHYWIRHETGDAWKDVVGAVGLDQDLAGSASRLLREADLATKGAAGALLRAPLELWSYLVRSGQTFEDDFYQPPPRRRVRF
jgi:hypothetical protein